MSTGWLAFAAVMLAAGAPAAADDVVYINQQKFTIPISVEPEKQREVSELMLYLSRDQGRTWEIYSRATADKRGFDFFAAGDGVFYFSIAVVDRHGKQDPPDAYRAPVGQKVCVDTKPPVISLTADRVGDEIQVAWTIQEDRPERESVKLEYKVGDSPSGQWTPLPIEFGERGNQRFKPQLPGPVTVRLSLRDLAKNESAEEKVVGGAARTDRSLSLASGSEPLGGAPLPPPQPVDTQTPPSTHGGTGTAPQTTLATSSQPPPTNHPPTPPTPPTTFQPTTGGSMPTRGQLPSLQIVNKRQVKLGFDVARFGPSGLAGVDVYMTADEGATWEKSPADPNVSLPVTAEARAAQPVRGSVTVNLPKDGQIYGFCLVVKSRAGLGKAPPRAGDAPQVRIEVDATQPEAELYKPMADQARPDSLVLMWKASDRNLSENPISLEWAARPEGPWTFIGDAQLPNTGRYLWRITDNTPPKVYLRLSVRDTAGNTAVAQTPQPELIDLTVPELNGPITVHAATSR